MISKVFGINNKLLKRLPFSNKNIESHPVKSKEIYAS